MKIDYAKITFVPADESQNEILFQYHKLAFTWFAGQVWGGWEKSFQRKVFAGEYEGTQPILILYNNQIVGSYTFT